MEGHWLEGARKANEPFDVIDMMAEFQRRRKLEERGTSNEGLRKERLRGASLSERIARRMDKHQIRPHSSDGS